MEFVGRTVKKIFPGFGVYSGVIESYDPSARYFKVLYEDGDSEEVDFGEIAALLMDMGDEAPEVKQMSKKKRGRPPKKRRRCGIYEGQASVGEDEDLGGGEGLVGEGELAHQNGALVHTDGNSSGVSEEILDFDVRQVGQNGDIACENALGTVSEGNDLHGNGGIDLNGGVDVNYTPDSLASSGHNLKRDTSYTAYLEGRKHEEMQKLDFGNNNIDAPSPEDPGTFGNCSMEGPKRKRRVSVNVSSLSEAPLRRSTRRASSNVIPNDDSAQRRSGSIASGLRDVETELCLEMIPKPELPQSSKDLDLDGLPILDFFSVYAFLRSFSRVLFLSPFSLQAFLKALQCKNANSLIDAIHLSILQALRQHLNFLSQEGSDSATYCLRSLNWGLLDLATWPVYLFEYLLLHGPIIKSLLKNTSSNLLNHEYYLLPAGLKLDILRCLCDDILEAETLRSELCLRMTQVDSGVDSWNISTRKRNEPLANGVTEETSDGNSDECILCGMDGSLICCDGCPAAFHSKCVGVAQELLPEGDWYCPECLIDKSDGLSKFLKSSRGAEIVGTDPHGRLYFSSCDYLLVLDSCETVASSNFYNKDDLNVLIRTLKLAHASYDNIAAVLSTYWDIAIDTSMSIIQPCNTVTNIVEGFSTKLDSENSLISNQNVVDDHTIEKQPKDLNLAKDELVSTNSSDHSQLNLRSSDQPLGMASLCETFEPESKMTHVADSTNVPQQSNIECSTVGNLANEGCSPESVDVAFQKKISFEFGSWMSKESPTMKGKDSILHQQADPVRYVNYYIFGLLASSVAKELLGKSVEISYKDSKSVDDFMSRQVKAISKILSNLCWYSCLKLSLEVQKERCGWCYSCKTSESTECIFILMDGKRLESSKSRLVGLRSEKNKKSHLVYAIQLLLSLEDRLRGFLSGPWDRPSYSNRWRNTVSKASQVTTLGHMLLILELNLRRIALSPDWTKLTDTTNRVGSGFCVLSGPVDLNTNFNGNRRQGRKALSAVDFGSIQAAFPSHICWWRGGKLSRQVFHWKMLPRSLALQSARQAGCKKIPILTYPDGLDFPRRSKFVAWRAAVEMSKTISQLIFQIKEFDYHIRWLEFSKAPPFLQLTKECKATDKLFKKVIVRKRRYEGESFQYLLDFGKRQNIPPIVTKHGVILEEPSCERKKFWLGEPHIPLYLVKSFEERKIARSLKRSKTKLLYGSANDCIIEKTKKSKGLSYLMSKAGKIHTEVCVQCNKDVLIREAMVCQECQGLFHRKHFRNPKGGSANKNICFSCNSKLTDKSTVQKKEAAKLVLKKGKTAKLILKKRGTGKSKTSMKKVSSKKNSGSTLTMVLRKKRKNVFVTSKKRTYGAKLSKKSKAKKTPPRKNTSVRDSSKRKRTTRESVFWLNGLLWSRKPHDEKGESFRNKRVCLPSQDMEITAPLPVCCLCLKEYSPQVIYVGCESCEGWFHGAIYDLSAENVNFLMGFKCPKCRAEIIPSCPFSVQSAIAEAKSPSKSTVADTDSVAHENQKSEENNDGEMFLGHSLSVQHSLDHELIDNVKKGEEMELLKTEPETESCDHLQFVPPAIVENQHSLDQVKVCNVGMDEDIPDVEVLNAEPKTESHDLLLCKPSASVQIQHSLDQYKDGNGGVDEVDVNFCN